MIKQATKTKEAVYPKSLYQIMAQGFVVLKNTHLSKLEGKRVCLKVLSAVKFPECFRFLSSILSRKEQKINVILNLPLYVSE